MRTAIISADSHVLKPGNLRQQRLDRKHRDRAPRIFQDAASGASHQNVLTILPSDYYKRQVYATFLEDPIGVYCAQLPLVGYINLMRGNDYPHGSSTWPNSRKVIDRIMTGVAPADRRRMLSDNCARLYGIALPRSARAKQHRAGHVQRASSPLSMKWPTSSRKLAAGA